MYGIIARLSAGLAYMFVRWLADDRRAIDGLVRLNING
jgi:hypothetical protein